MHPQLFKIGSLAIGTYGVIVAFGVFVAIIIGRKLARREGLDPETITDFFVYSILAGFVGAKIALIIGDFREFSEHPVDYLLQNIRSFGAFYGGFAAAVLVALFYIKKKRMSFLQVADLSSVVLPVGQAIGRWGCFFAGCCYGSPTKLPWGMVFPAVDICADGTRIHPWPVYESIWDAIIFAFLFRLFGRKKFRGQVFTLYAILYASGRFVLEFLRGDTIRGLYFGGSVSLSQIFALTVLACALPAYFILGKERHSDG